MNGKRHTDGNITCLIMVAALSLSFLFCGSWDKISTQEPRIENMGIFGINRKQSVIGQDGCTPIPVGNTMMWTFGDTIIGTWKGDLTVNATFEDSAVMKGMISNSVAFTQIPDDTSIRNLDFTFYKEKGTVAQFIKNMPGEDPSVWRFWAIDGIEIEGTVYVYYIIVLIEKNLAKKENPGLPIRVKGVGIAEWKIPGGWKPGDPVNFKRTAKVFLEGEPVFGDGVIRRGNHLFLIGHGPAAKNRVPAFMARVPVSSIKKRASYEFLDADGHWTGAISAAAAVADDVMGEPSLSFNETIKEYIIIYCSLDGKIKTIQFNDFSLIRKKKTAVLYLPPSLPLIPARSHLAYYSGKEIYSTGRALYAIYINPAIYQPILLKIPYQCFR
jgi:hypothetical protein